MKEFVMGDCHGGYRALKQCLERCEFNYGEDRLVFLGDVCDGWPESYECLEELMKIKNLIFVRGNHDQWLKDWLKEGKQPLIWTMQGGQNTLKSYMKHNPSDWKRHLNFLKTTKFYHIDDNNRIFVHGGIKPGVDPALTDKMFLSWDRTLWDERWTLKDIEDFKEVYIGHTSIAGFHKKPVGFANVRFIDTGGGWEWKLSIMEINSKLIWQSDKVSDLYPEEDGRNSKTKITK